MASQSVSQKTQRSVKPVGSGAWGTDKTWKQHLFFWRREATCSGQVSKCCFSRLIFKTMNYNWFQLRRLQHIYQLQKTPITMFEFGDPKLRFGGFLKWWYPKTIGFSTKTDHFGPPLKESPIFKEMRNLWGLHRMGRNSDSARIPWGQRRRWAVVVFSTSDLPTHSRFPHSARCFEHVNFNEPSQMLKLVFAVTRPWASWVVGY